MSRPLDVLFEDEDFLVVNKPAGIPVHGGAGVSKRTVLDRLPPGLHPVHRLDADTSGALLLARSSRAASAASATWSEAEKRYLALLTGAVRDLIIDTPLTDPSGRQQAARTVVKALALDAEGRVSLAQVDIGTGRMHQIRRHLAEAGHPVAMDDRYGDFAANKAIRRHVRAHDAPSPRFALLHALRLTWDGRSVTAPLPDRWTAWLDAFGISSGAPNETT